jgi:hypothetical protein
VDNHGGPVRPHQRRNGWPAFVGGFVNDEILVALGRHFVDWSLQKESMIRKIQELQAQLDAATKAKE